MSADRIFVDTAFLLWAHDADGGIRHEQASWELGLLWAGGSGAVSTQVLEEF